MSLANIAYLVMVVAGFTSFAAGLFYGWVLTNWSAWFPGVSAKGDLPSAAPAAAADYAKAA